MPAWVNVIFGCKIFVTVISVQTSSSLLLYYAEHATAVTVMNKGRAAR